MKASSDNRGLQLGDLVAAAFDEAKGLSPKVANDLVTRAITDALLRTGNTRALRALIAEPVAGGRDQQDDAHDDAQDKGQDDARHVRPPS